MGTGRWDRNPHDERAVYRAPLFAIGTAFEAVHRSRQVRRGHRWPIAVATSSHQNCFVSVYSTFVSLNPDDTVGTVRVSVRALRVLDLDTHVESDCSFDLIVELADRDNVVIAPG